ncbi:MAG: VWA domain-containing protein, partial [Acidobacteria bacterium]|nr:VWA domain-containing protein [Acidobacteriota bacterium]
MIIMKPGPGLVLLLAIISGVFAKAGSQSVDDTLKVIVDLVDVQFSVTDRRGRFVPGLRAQDFLVQEDGRRQEIRNFSRESELPLTLGLLIDTSPSVRP